MLNANELGSIVLAVIVLGFIGSWNTFRTISLYNFLIVALFFLIILAVNIAAKKIMAYYLETSVETKIWHFQRWGWYERSHLRNPFPIGIVLPFLLSVATLGYVPWYAVTQTEMTALKERVAKRHDFYSYSELTEFHIASVAASGIIFVLFLAFISYLINEPILARLAIFFAAFNMLPLGQLDGNKIFHGSIIMWFVFAAITLIALGYALLLI